MLFLFNWLCCLHLVITVKLTLKSKRKKKFSRENFCLGQTQRSYTIFFSFSSNSFLIIDSWDFLKFFCAMTFTLRMKKVYSVSSDSTHLKMTLYLNFYSYIFNPLLVFLLFLLNFILNWSIKLTHARIFDYYIAFRTWTKYKVSINYMLSTVSFDMLLPNTSLHMATEIMYFYIIVYICFISVHLS